METCLSCGVCARYLSESPMRSHEIQTGPWSKISAYIFHLDGTSYLVMVDHYSDFFEQDPVKNAIASTVIRAMKSTWIPEKCVTDNGPQFDGHEYSKFAQEYGFTMIKSTTAGEMERLNLHLRLPKAFWKHPVSRILIWRLWRTATRLNWDMISRQHNAWCLKIERYHSHSRGSTCSTKSVARRVISTCTSRLEPHTSHLTLTYA